MVSRRDSKRLSSTEQWGESIAHIAVYIGNRLLANLVENNMPYEIIFGERPNLSNFV